MKLGKAGDQSAIGRAIRARNLATWFGKMWSDNAPQFPQSVVDRITDIIASELQTRRDSKPVFQPDTEFVEIVRPAIDGLMYTIMDAIVQTSVLIAELREDEARGQAELVLQQLARRSEP